MAFFFKKPELNLPGSETETPRRVLPTEKQVSIPEQLPRPVHIVPTPSAEGLAIAQRLSGQPGIAIPAGFTVRANHLMLEGTCVIEGEFEGVAYGLGKTEIATRGVLKGEFIGDDLSVFGVLDGAGVIDRLEIKSGGLCRGAFKGRVLALGDGGVFDGEYSRII